MAFEIETVMREPDEGKALRTRHQTVHTPIFSNCRKAGKIHGVKVSTINKRRIRYANQSAELFHFLRKPRAPVAGACGARAGLFRGGSHAVDSRQSRHWRGIGRNSVEAIAGASNSHSHRTR